MDYVNYEFYSSVYGGARDEVEFCRYVGRAGFVLEDMTQGRVKTLYPEPAEENKKAVGMAMSAIIDGIAKSEEKSGRTVVLEAVGKHRVAYANTVQNAALELRKSVQPFLRGTRDGFGVPLLFRATNGEGVRA